MKKLFLFTSLLVAMTACNSNEPEHKTDNSSFTAFLDHYYEGRLKLFPLEATFIGDKRYNDTLTIDISEGERWKQRQFFQSTLDSLEGYQYEDLNENDKLSYLVLKNDLQLAIEGLKFHDNYMPVNQFGCVPLSIGQLAGGGSAQPFETVADYNNWLKRLDDYVNWLDTSVVYFRKGIDSGIVLPETIVVKMIPQLAAMTTADENANLFYAPVHNMPAGFSDSDKQYLKQAFAEKIGQEVIPAYKRLLVFLEKEYMPHARSSSGVGSLPDGIAYYNYLIRLNTTTSETADEIYNTGLSEVKRISTEMEKIKNDVGFKGDLRSFLQFLKTGKQFMPFKKPEEVLNAFRRIRLTMQPNLQRMFTDTPKTKFEIRQTEAFRAASASAEYQQGTPDGSRPGIFYVPIVDAAKFNITSGMESLFLHEAIPGHHYQVSLQQENTSLPKFRRFSGNNAYVEGWALYCASLGKELGLYTDPYQYMGALGDEMHRAVRLVVDVAIHTKNMSREEAIRYMTDHMLISEEGAIAEIERYMVWPGQALSYKIGSLKIISLRKKYEAMAGARFSLAEFHRQVLKDGPLPLGVLEQKLDEWAKHLQ